MWENPIFKKVWEVGKKSAVLMKKHYKNGLMLGVLLLAMFFLGRSIGAIAYGLRMQREIKSQATAGTALENTKVLFSAENWGLGFGAEGTQPTGTASVEKLKEYNAYYVGDAEEKKIYLTFDCGYENGNSSAILDALKKHDAPATFFVVGHFLESAPEMVKRMVEDGHTVGNHTYHHYDMSKISDPAVFRLTEEVTAIIMPLQWHILQEFWAMMRVWRVVQLLQEDHMPHCLHMDGAR